MIEAFKLCFHMIIKIMIIILISFEIYCNLLNLFYSKYGIMQACQNEYFFSINSEWKAIKQKSECNRDSLQYSCFKLE